MNYHRLRVAIIGATLGGAALSVMYTVRGINRTATSQEAAEAVSRGLPNREQKPFERSVISQPAAVWQGRRENSSATVSLQKKFVDARTVVMNDASLQNLYFKSERAHLAARYAFVWKALNLPQSESDQLRDLIMQRDEKCMDLDAVVRSNQLNLHDPAVARLRAEAERTFRTAVIELLGEPAYLELARYERALLVWQFVNTFAGSVALEGQPLSSTQAVQLSETLATASPAYQAGGSADPNTIDWLAVLPASTVILTEPQQASFLNALPQYPTLVAYP